ncbi:MAG TPA: hypothetical protein VFE61_01290 [Candidatus Sulfotelmatobacter sp.]|jgi:hypothetical protein|nr:hypothetical protein [Candidatus Sulfotelmatobacter sp.]
MRGGVGQVFSESFEQQDATHRSEFRIGGVSVGVSGQHWDDVTLVPSLEPFRVETPASDINIQVEWAEKLRSPSGPQLFDSGSVWRLYEDGTEFQFDFSASLLGEQPYKRLFVDRCFRRATLQMSEECFAGTDYLAAPLEYPLDELLIMHRLTQEKAIELHSCGIVRPDGTGNLFVGHSGAGKSTTTRLWTGREAVEVLSDDRIIVRRDVADIAGCMRMYGTPWHGEAAYASPASAPLARIFILEHGHGNVLTPLSPSQAVAELFARSFVPFHRHEYVDSALQFLQELVDAVPCYRYAFEPNEAAVERILEFRD